MSCKELMPHCWPVSQLEAALQALAKYSGLEPEVAEHKSLGSALELNARLQAGAETLDLQVEQVSCSYPELETMLLGAAPALLRVRFPEGEYFIALCGGRGHKLRLLTPALQVEKVCLELVIQQLACELEGPQRERIEQLLDSAHIQGRRRKKATTALLRENLASVRLDDFWLLRQSSHRSFRLQLRQRGLYWRFAAMLACHSAQMAIFLCSWWVIGRAVLEGHIDTGWLSAWVLLLVTQVPLSLLTARLRGVVSVETGALLKQRLLASALRVIPSRIRHMGSGQVLGRVYDAENIEASALQGAFLLLLGVVELLIAASILLMGAGGLIYAAILPLFLAVAFFLGRAQYYGRKEWTAQRLSMTHRLIEKMIGHRTRLAQQAPGEWHQGEDSELNDYLESSSHMDNTMARLQAFLPRLWLLLGIVGLAPIFISDSASSTQLAIAFGGMLLGYRAVLKCMNGFTSALSAAISWEKVRELFSLEDRHLRGSAGLAMAASAGQQDSSQPLCYLRDIRFTYEGKDQAVLAGCNLSIYPGDRLLLQGTSGSGKSTLANVLTGIQKPDDGLLLLNGYDRASIGAEPWRRMVASAPQFHENHVLGDSFLFNLLMGDQWPPRQESLRKAYAICDELGLTPLLKKMPAGILQTVGEMGWRLSHGEMSRLFIARALLQNAELVVLDESFAALDPENLQMAVACVQKNAKTLMVIAHP
ncbi:ATP-binding cassette domain-containing protein [Microbulbifer sp. PAAF003]|uniref:ATP-binding cassette domain-containing protein n=1 Tax=Microbulbifer sp. PAAF003 TaxID=3243375 RepID=UPI004039B262